MREKEEEFMAISEQPKEDETEKEDYDDVKALTHYNNPQVKPLSYLQCLSDLTNR